MTIRILSGTTAGPRETFPCTTGGLPVQDGGGERIDLPVIVDLAPGDTATVQAVYAGLSPQSRYRRFQISRPCLPAGTLRGLADMQPGRHVAHVALLAGRPVGLVRWIRWGGPRSAELAYEVVDVAQRRGLGLALLRRAAGSASTGGIEFFLAQLPAGDQALHRRARRLGGRPDLRHPDLYRLPVATIAGESVLRSSGPADRPHVVA